MLVGDGSRNFAYFKEDIAVSLQSRNNQIPPVEVHSQYQILEHEVTVALTGVLEDMHLFFSMQVQMDVDVVKKSLKNLVH